MAIKLGSSSVTVIYLGDYVYGSPNVVKIYIGSTQVWASA